MVKNETRVVLIGRTGNGKSETGNSLLDCRTAFEARDDLSSVTRETARKTAILTGSKTIAVVDTPGLFDTNSTEENVINEIVKCIGLSSPGPHAFLYVLKIGAKLTNEEAETLKKFVFLFGERLYNFLIIVFTHKGNITGKTIREYAKQAPPFFTNLLKLCDNRIIAIENLRNENDRTETVKHLLHMIEGMKRRAESFYTHQMFTYAELAIAKRIKELGKDANRADVLKEVEKGGRTFDYLLATGVGVLVGGILVGSGVLVGCLATTAAYSAAAAGATSLAVEGAVAAAGATAVTVGGTSGAATAAVAAGSTGSAVGAPVAAAVASAGYSCVII